MTFSNLIEKSIRYPWKNRSLWFYGIILAIFGAGSNVLSSYSPEDGELEQHLITAREVTGLTAEAFTFTFFALIILAIVFVIVSTVIMSWSQVAINRGVAQIEKKKRVTRKELGQTGKRVIWRVLVLDVFLPLGIIFGSLIVIILGVALIVAMPEKVQLFLGVPAGFGVLALAIFSLFYFPIVWAMAQRFVTNDNQKPVQALKSANQLVRGRYWQSFTFALVNYLILVVAILLALIPLALLVMAVAGFFVVEVWVSIIFGLLALCYILFFVIYAGYFHAYLQAALTLWWLELKKTK